MSADLTERVAELIRRYGDDVRCVVHPDDLPTLRERYPAHYRDETPNIMATLAGVGVVTSQWVERGSVTFMPIVPEPRHPEIGDIGAAIQRIEQLLAARSAKP